MIYKKIKLEGNKKIWFTSDTHYGHKNICKGVTEWDVKDHGGDNSVRDFKTLDAMNAALVDGINKYVGEDDYLVHLGDWSFGGLENIWKFRRRVNCKNIIFILGNHDHHIANDRDIPDCWVRCRPPFELVDTQGSTSDFDEPAKAEDLFESVHAYLELVVSSSSLGKQTYNLMHFPLAIWNKGHHNRVMLYGHVHGSFQHPGRALDVGMDNAFKMFGEYRPFSQEDINIFMKGREFTQFSHHNKNTN